MSKDTWNFGCHQTQDGGPAGSRNTNGTLFATGDTHPFTTEMTSIFSFLIRSGWTSQDGAEQGLFTIGRQGINESVGYYFYLSSTNPSLSIRFRDDATVRYNVLIGDEDGTNWLQTDKWYQFAISATASGITYACNGTDSPKETVATDVPGALNIGIGSSRIWMTSPSASFGANDPIAVTQNWPSVVLGACAHYTTGIDLSSATVRDRIFDSSGDFKSPGENGSLWFGDTYGDVIPEYYFPTGVPYHNLGSDVETWNTWDGGASNTRTPIGGLRKQFES